MATPRPTLWRDIRGDVYGSLTAIERIGSDGHGHTLWRFRCQCGAIIEKSASDVHTQVRKGSHPSCGSFQCSHYNKLPDGQAAINRRIYIYKHGARERGIEWALSNEEATELFRQSCHYCGAAPSKVTKPGSRSKPLISSGIDRIDNAKGYVPGNVVSCCEQCNRAKGKLSTEEFLAWVERVHAHDK